MADLVSRVRLELGDASKMFTFSATGDGVTKDYYLNEKPVDPYTLYVQVTNQAVPAPFGYKLEKDQGLIHFRDALPSGATLFVAGTSYRYFTDEDIERFVSTAVDQHCHERTDAFGRRMSIALLPPVEEYPIAILAVIEALWALATDAAFDIDITAPDGVVIPRSQRYSQLTSTIERRWEQYHQLCSALNIGLWRIQMGTLRRVSRLTNKLVPLYVAQEIEDSRRPERIYMANDVMGFNPPVGTTQVYDIVMYQGDKFERIIDMPFAITNLIWKAEIRTYPNSPSKYATFDVTILDVATGRIKLTLDKSKTAYLPARAFWDLQATSSVDDTWEKTYLRGQVFVTQQVTLD
jgi:hypothetical protein